MLLHRSALFCCLWLLLGPASSEAKKPLPKRGPAPAAGAAPAAAPVAAPPAPAEATVPASAPAAAPPAAAPTGAAPPAAPPPAAASPAEAAAAPASSSDAAASPPANADAQTPPAAAPALTPVQLELAKKHFDAGTQAFAEQHYETALNEFTTSFEISREPDLLYNLYRVAVRLEQKELALNYLRDYLRYRPEEAAKLQPEIDKLTAPPAPPPAAVASSASVEGRRTAPRWPGAVLMVLGGASAATGAALLIATSALPTDAATDQVRSSSLLGAGSFLVATGAVELIAGIAIYVARRPQAQLALVPTGSGLGLVGRF